MPLNSKNSITFLAATFYYTQENVYKGVKRSGKYWRGDEGHRRSARMQWCFPEENEEHSSKGNSA